MIITKTHHNIISVNSVFNSVGQTLSTKNNDNNIFSYIPTCGPLWNSLTRNTNNIIRVLWQTLVDIFNVFV